MTTLTENKMHGLTNDTIMQLMAKSRTRDAYGPKLVEFMESDEAAINPAEVWPIEFSGKKSTTLYQGFNLALNKANLKDKVHLIQRDGSVFLLHKERVELALTPSDEE